jgi:hypothetical protein
MPQAVARALITPQADNQAQPAGQEVAAQDGTAALKLITMAVLE